MYIEVDVLIEIDSYIYIEREVNGYRKKKKNEMCTYVDMAIEIDRYIMVR